MVSHLVASPPPPAPCMLGDAAAAAAAAAAAFASGVSDGSTFEEACSPAAAPGAPPPASPGGVTALDYAQASAGALGREGRQVANGRARRARPLWHVAAQNQDLPKLLPLPPFK
jgi:hypothetical protein